MKKKTIYAGILLMLLLISGCGTSSQQNNYANNEGADTAQTTNIPHTNKVSSINIHGKLPKNEKSSIEVIFDMNNNNIIDQNETNHKVTYRDLSEGYTLNRINTHHASKMWLTYRSGTKVPQRKVFDITTDNYTINIDHYLKQEHYIVDLDKSRSDKYLILLVHATNKKLTVSHLYSPYKTTDDANSLIQLSIPLKKLSQQTTKINAYFHTHINDELRKPHSIDGKKVLLDISQSISYSLYDQNNEPIALNKRDISYKLQTKGETFLYVNQKVFRTKAPSNTSTHKNNSATGQLLAAKILPLGNPQNICIKVVDKDQNPQNSVLVEAHSRLDIASKYTNENGEAVLRIYQNINDYSFDYSAFTQSIYNVNFNISQSTENNCSYEAKITIDNPNTRNLSLTVVEDNNLSLKGEYISIHNNDYSFYAYGYLDENGKIDLLVPRAEELNATIGSQSYRINANETKKTVHFTKESSASVYLYFEKENNSDDFPKLHVMAVGSNLNKYTPSANQRLLSNNSESSLHLQRTDTYDGYKIWVYNIDETMPTENEFEVVVSNGTKEINEATTYFIEDFPTIISNISFVTSDGVHHTPKDNLYTNVPYKLEYNISDKNHNIRKVTPGSNIMFTNIHDTLTFRMEYSNTTIFTSQSFAINLNPSSVVIIDISKIKDKTLMGNYTFTVLAADKSGGDLTYNWTVNGITKSTSKTLDIALLKEERITIKCIVSNATGMDSYQKTTRVYYPSPKIQNYLENIVLNLNETKEFSINAINPDIISNDSLHHDWYLDDVLVSSDATYNYTQNDNNEHTLKCIVSNKYKRSSSEAKIGNLSLINYTIHTLEGNKVYIYDNNMSIAKSYDVNESGIVSYNTIKSKINISSVFTPDTVLTPLLFSRVAVYGISHSNHVLDKKRISLNHIDGQKYYRLNRFPNLYDLDEKEQYLNDLRSCNSNNDGYLDIQELYAFGLSKYDTNSDGKIQVKELKGYEDASITMKLAIVKKGNTNTSINIKEDEFVPVFKKMIGNYYGNDLGNILYATGEYRDINITIDNIPSSFDSTSDNNIPKLFKSLDHEFSLIQREENASNDTLTWTFNIKMHLSENDNNLLPIIIYHNEDPGSSDPHYKSYSIEHVDSNSSATFSYESFIPTATIDLTNDYSRMKGTIVSKINNNYLQTGILETHYGEETDLDRYALPYGYFFNIEHEIYADSNIKIVSSNRNTYDVDKLYMFEEVFDINDSNILENQYLNTYIEEDENIEGVYNILGFDSPDIDLVRHIYNSSNESGSDNYYYYIMIDDTNTENFKYMDVNSCLQMFGTNFCANTGLDSEWGNATEIQLIDFKYDTNQSLEAPHRIKSFLTEERAQ